MDFLISESFRNHGFRQKDIEKALIYEAIVDSNETTRKRLYQDLRMRPNNISFAVQELLDGDLIYEDNLVKNSKQGRPEILIKTNLEKLVSISMWVESSRLASAIINIKGEKKNKQEVEVPSNVSNSQFLGIVTKQIDLLLNNISGRQRLLGIGLSLPGVVNHFDSRWIFNSRWPDVRNLDFSKVSDRYQVPIYLCRMLEAELQAMVLRRKPLQDKSVVLLHWGYGIGAAFFSDGKVFQSGFGSTFEIGHIKTASVNSEKQCTCRETGCLETIASGWALFPDLEKKYGKFSENEAEVGQKLAEINPEDEPALITAEKAIAQAVNTLVRIVYPDVILAYGPFLSNPVLRQLFFSEIKNLVPYYMKDYITLEVVDGELSNLDCIGSTVGFFKSKLLQLLVAG